MLMPHLSCQTCIHLSGLFDIRQRRQSALRLAQIFRQCDVASFTSTGNMPKEVKEALWRSRISLWTMHLVSQDSLKLVKSGSSWILWAKESKLSHEKGHRQTEGHLRVAYDFTARNWRVTRDFQQLRWNKKLTVNGGSRGCYHFAKSTLGNNGCLAKVSSPGLEGSSPR